MDNRKLILDRLAQHIEELRGFTRGLSEAQLRARPAPNKWSLHELTMHMVEVQDIFIERVARMLSEERPSITPFSPDAARKEGMYLSLTFRKRMEDFELQRRNLFTLVGNLNDAQWRREGAHPDIKHYTLEKCLESLMRHEEHHLHQMFNLFFGISD